MELFSFSPELMKKAETAEKKSLNTFYRIEKNCRHNSQKVLKAFIDNNVSEMHLKGTTGYGYGDDGRDKADRVFADIVGAEDALVRYNFVNGTHALSTMLFGI
ncbi:MAG: methionine gamma-lyase family protein, partial [Ruminiclostridium sp.]|nr:methionine gamma-lyase family protein [Ruminiclostridium sp.]